MLVRRRFLLPLRLTALHQANLGSILYRYNRLMNTLYTFVPSPGHVYPDHPERPGRLDILQPRLKSFEAEFVEVKPATREQIAYVHRPKLVSALEQVCREQAPGIIDYAPTYVTRSSFDDALLAAGGVVTCVEAVVRGEAENAFAIVRPPGHHAEPDRAMGFCIFNNIAIGARYAIEGNVRQRTDARSCR